MIKRYESCWGLSLPAVGKWKIEFWFAPPGYQIKEHTHDEEDIKLVLLFGHNVKFHRLKKGDSVWQVFFATWHNIGRSFTINAGDAHSFAVSSWPLIFMNIEHWHAIPTSACKDFNLWQHDNSIAPHLHKH
jgi:hypothetical protein